MLTKLLPQLKQPKLMALLFIGVLVITGIQTFATAQTSEIETGSEAIVGTLTENEIPVGGVRIEVFQGDTKIDEATSDEQGNWRVPVPSEGTYRVRIDTSSLPSGVALTDIDRDELPSVLVFEGQQKRVFFKLGEGISSGGITRAERISNLLISGLRLGAIIAMAGAGLALIFSVTNLVNFAHGELVTLGALLAYFFTTMEGGPGLHIVVATIPIIIIIGLFTAASELVLWKPIRKRNMDPLSMMIISIGLSLFLRYLYLVFFGTETRALKDYAIQDTVSFLTFTTVPKTLWIIAIAIFVLLGIALFLLLTRHGTSLRALSNNSALAKSSGINVDKAILVSWLVGATVTSLAGILLAISQNVSWNMGWDLLLFIFAALILGGTKSVFGAMVGGMVIGIVTELSTYWIDAELKSAIALALMVVILLWRPQGILGWNTRTA